MKSRTVEKTAVDKLALSKYLYIAIFVLGAIAFLYPLVTSLINQQTQTQVISNYHEEMRDLSDQEKAKLEDEAVQYNEHVASLEGNVTDEMTDAEKASTDIVYMSVLSTGEIIGYLEIPKIDVELPIYRGASDEVLQRGVGHLERSTLPVGGSSTHSVLTGHRGLPQARMFRDLDKLTIGDVFVVDVLGDKLAYEVESIQSVYPNEVESLRVQEGRDLCTLVTCDPYMINSHRMLVTAHRTEYSPGLIEEAAEHQISFFEKYIEYFAIGGIVAVGWFVVWLARLWLKRRQAQGERVSTSRKGSDNVQ